MAKPRDYCQGTLLLMFLTGLAFTLGCGTSLLSKEVELPSQTLTEAPSPEGEVPDRSSGDDLAEGAELGEGTDLAEGSVSLPEGEPAPPVEDVPTLRDNQSITIVTVSEQPTEATPRTLFEASQEARRQRAGRTAPPTTVITNSNIAEQAEGGQLTILTETNEPENIAAPTTTDGVSEQYWRGEALRLRLNWKAEVEEVSALQTEVAELRRRFYDEDDPFYRDNEIKPAWDRALIAIEEAREEVAEYQDRMDAFLEDGRRSGALPGWLREGIEFEPARSKPDTAPERRREEDPREPKLLNEEAIRQ